MVFSRRVFVYCYLNKGVIVFVLMVLLYYCYLLAYIHNKETKKQHKPGRSFCSVIISMFFRLSSLFPSFATPSLLRVLFNYLFIIVPQSLPGTSTSELSLCLSLFSLLLLLIPTTNKSTRLRTFGEKWEIGTMCSPFSLSPLLLVLTNSPTFYMSSLHGCVFSVFFLLSFLHLPSLALSLSLNIAEPASKAKHDTDC